MFAQYAPLPLSHFKATLPQNATTSELTEFLSSYFRVVLPEWVVPNLVAVTILLGGLVVSAIAIMYVKIFKSRTFWLFRLQGSDSGNLLVVSPTSSFVIIEGLYAIGLLIMSWCMGEWKEKERGRTWIRLRSNSANLASLHSLLLSSFAFFLIDSCSK